MAVIVAGFSRFGAVSITTKSCPSSPWGMPSLIEAEVALPCGSQSQIDADLPASKRAAANKSEQVVLPTPPLPFTNATRVAIEEIVGIGQANVNYKASGVTFPFPILPIPLPALSPFRVPRNLPPRPRFPAQLTHPVHRRFPRRAHRIPPPFRVLRALPVPK